MSEYDVIVVGAGNAAFCAALAAQEQGAKVLMLEAAPEDEAGGNSRFTAGSIRVVYNGVDDIKTLVPDLTEEEIDTTDFGTYTQDQFFDDMARVTQHRADPDLVELLVTRSFDTLNWMREKGVRFIPIYGRQAFKIDGKFKFWGGLTVEAVGGGPGLVNMLTEAAKKRGIEIRYQHPRARSLYRRRPRRGRARAPRRPGERDARQVRWCSPPAASRPIRNGARAISARAGTSPRCAARASTPATASAWRSTSAPARAATGRAATRCGWEMNAPEFGDLAVGDQFQKHSYPFAIMVNATGKRFVDEGADFRNYTYAKYGRVILEQPGQFAWQIFDQKVKHLQRDEYRIRQITKVTANTIEELAGKLEGVNAARVRQDHRGMEQGGAHGRPVQSERQGRPPHRKASPSTRATGRTRSTSRRTKAYAVTCGITFTFGGLAHQHRRRGAQHRLPADPRALRGRRTGRRHLLLQLSGRLGPVLRLGVRQDRRHVGRRAKAN